MSHNNLMSLYCYIEDRRQEADGAITAADEDEDQKQFAKGRRAALDEFEQFLHDNLDRKLPRRIYRQLKAQSNSCDSRYAIDK